LTTSTTILP